MARLVFLLAFGALIAGCKRRPVNPDWINPLGDSIVTRVKTPPGYSRTRLEPGSFGDYLRNLKLKPAGAEVHYFDGRLKPGRGIYMAVIDMPIGNKDLQQCADAVMHLRAQYLYESGNDEKIHFTFTNGFPVSYSTWKQGYRIAVKGNNTKWVRSAEPSGDSLAFWQYLEIVFTYCGSLSLSRELTPIHYDKLMPGDVFVKGGTPGHAEIVVDMAENKYGDRIYLLAQSAMPAQEIQLLTNPSDAALSPWYELKETAKEVQTPEMLFTTGQLMRFKEE